MKIGLSPIRIDLTVMAGNPRRYAGCIMTNRRINAPVTSLIGVQVAVGLTLCQCAKTVVPITLNSHESKEDSGRTGISLLNPNHNNLTYKIGWCSCDQCRLPISLFDTTYTESHSQMVSHGELGRGHCQILLI